MGRHPSVTSAREWRETRAAWLGKRHRWGFGGAHLLDYRETRLGEWYLVSTKGTGRRATHFRTGAHAEEVAEDLDLASSRVRVTRHRLAGRVEVFIRLRDPWASPLIHPLTAESPEAVPPARRSVRDPAVVGMNPETGAVLTVPLWDETGGKNVSVTGIKGAGKGVLLDNLSEHVTGCADGMQVRVNISVKGYAEAASWGPACHLTAFGSDQKSRAVAVLKVICRVIEWRARTYKRGVYEPSPRDPLIVLITDESDSAAAVPAVKALLNDIATKGREYGVTYVHAGQRATYDYTSGKQKSQDDVYCTGMVSRRGEVRHAAGSMASQVPDMATYGEGKPGVWSVAVLGAGQQDGRTWVFAASPAAHAEHVERIAAERAFTQPDLPAACREYLGTAYEALLATDVFARWARGAEDDGDLPAPEDAPAMPASPETGADGTERAPGSVVTAQDDVAGRLEQELDVDDDTRAAFSALDAKLKGVRRMNAETNAMPRPEMSPEAAEAAAEEAWRQVGEQAEIPAEVMERLLGMLREGTTAGGVARALAVSKWTARTWLEKLRGQGAAYVDGEKRAARWRLAPPPPEGDAQ